ncbi:hypothetical protein DNX69_19980 [Rhodopseudomonas palustris]|uniref:Uncharacterized protein n=1 Tax=Rhodopseudomonas palustris TaxID=1076 RepID=A0A323UCT4_RHOPL|nr:hypothetical protein DNX69_19980 [Rhodopseudomonas palustris]
MTGGCARGEPRRAPTARRRGSATMLVLDAGAGGAIAVLAPKAAGAGCDASTNCSAFDAELAGRVKIPPTFAP